MTRARKTNLFFLWMLVFYIAGCLFVIPVLPDSCFKNYSSIVIGQSLIFIPFVLYLIVTRGKPLKDLKVRRIGVLNTFLLVILTYCMIPVVSFLNVLTMMFAKNEVSGQLDGMSNNNFLFNIFITAFVPAIMEELIFRGVLYSGYRNSTIKRAILASALAFGLFHMNVNQFCYAFFMGIVFALVREATGSMHSSMIMHFLVNANSVVLLKLYDILTKYVNKMANNDSTFRELADSLNSSADSAVTFADYPLSQKLSLLSSTAFSAVIAFIIGMVILMLIARRCHRKYHIDCIMASFTGNRHGMPDINNYKPGEYIETNTSEYGGKIVDFVFVTAVILCIMLIIYSW